MAFPWCFRLFCNGFEGFGWFSRRFSKASLGLKATFGRGLGTAAAGRVGAASHRAVRGGGDAEGL